MRVTAPRCGGFTALELTCAMVVLGLIVAISTPSITHFYESWKLDNEVTQLTAALRTANNVAVMKKKKTVFKVDRDSGSYFFFEDDNNNAEHDSGETRSANFELSGGIKFAGLGGAPASPTVVFGPRGIVGGGAELVLETKSARTATVNVLSGSGSIQVN